VSGEWTAKLAIISCKYAFDWTVGYFDLFATVCKLTSVVRERGG